MPIVLLDVLVAVESLNLKSLIIISAQDLPSTQRFLLMKICAQGGEMDIPELLSPSHGFLLLVTRVSHSPLCEKQGGRGPSRFGRKPPVFA